MTRKSLPHRPSRRRSLSEIVDHALCGAVADRLACSKGNGSVFSEKDHKFISEAVIATAVVGSERALELNRRLGESLFAPSVAAILLHNPRKVTLYALPLAFLAVPPPAHAGIVGLFRRLHEARSTKALSYPTYRNHEIDYVYARLARKDFHVDPFDGFERTLPWLSRDNIYGLTHIHFYNSDFFRRPVRYESPAPAIVDALAAKAYAEDDRDILLELMLCEASRDGVSTQRARFCDHLVLETLADLIDIDSGELADRPFDETYHLLFLAWMYVTVRGEEFEPCPDSDETQRLTMLGRTMVSLRSGAFMAVFANYADYVDGYGEHPAVESALPLFQELVANAVTQSGVAGALAPAVPAH